MKTNTLFYILCVVITGLTLAGCSTSAPTVSPELMMANVSEYRLNTGDQIKVIVFGEDDLSGTYTIDGMGRVALPLIGDVIIRDKTVGEAEARIIENYSRDYLKDPKVTVQVAQYRPFYILGEVKQPGSYPYVDSMTILNAVVLGGGFTYRADKHDIEIKRMVKSQKGNTTLVFKSTFDTPVLPGDIIEIDERLF